MIISCPSCGTLYRYAEVPAASRARCSCCEGAVPLASRRPYLVSAVARAETLVAAGEWPSRPHPFRVERQPAATAAFPSTALIGMDDPALAGRLERTALDPSHHGSGHAPALTWTMLASDSPGTVGVGISQPDPPNSGSATGPARQPAEHPEKAAGRDGFVRMVVVGVAAGAVAGFAGASWFGGSSVAWWIGGALTGSAIVLGLRSSWTSRND